MKNWEKIAKVEKLSAKKWADELCCMRATAANMRANLASDIVAGYHLHNVTRQMLEIEDYEETLEYLTDELARKNAACK